jgi:very-short-patch-repair endonuclease
MIKRRKSRRETTNKTTEFAKSLRTCMTPAERLLWSRLRRNAIGVHFRRQAPIGNYILDFYCVKSKLAIEVDGDIHADRTAHDTERSEWLDSQKQIRVLRVTNQDVLENVDGVLMYILQELAPPPPLPSPVKKIT